MMNESSFNQLISKKGTGFIGLDLSIIVGRKHVNLNMMRRNSVYAINR